MVRKSIVLTLAGAAVLSLGISASAQNLTWAQSTAALPTGNVQMHGTAVVDVDGTDYIYIISGNTTEAGGDSLKIFYAATSAASADLTWNTATYQFPDASAVYTTRSCIGYNGRLYIVGGTYNSAGTDYNGIRVLDPTATGDVTALQQEFDGSTATPVLDRFEMAVAVRDSAASPGDGVMYIVGGGSPTRVTDVQKVTISGTTGEISGSVTTAGNLVTGVGSMQAAILNDYLYTFGGYTGTGGTDAVQFGQLGGDDNIVGGTMAATTSLPGIRYDGGAAAYNGTLYVLGGTVTGNADAQVTVFRATVDSGTGAITAWNADTDIPRPSGITTGGFRRVGAAANANAIFMAGGRMDGSQFSDLLQVGFIPGSDVSDWNLY